MDVETRGMPARGIIAAVGLAGALALPGVAVLLTSISVGTPHPSSAVSTTAPPAVPTVPSEVAGLQVERDDLARHTQELEARNAWLAAIVEAQLPSSTHCGGRPVRRPSPLREIGEAVDAT